MTKTIINELEGLEILEAMGLSNGEERQKAHYKKEGYINTGRALDAYLAKLEQIHTYAKLVINPNSEKRKPYGGKKRLIELGEKRDSIIERIDGRADNGDKETEDEFFIKELLFNKLINFKIPSYALQGLSFKGWADYFDLFDTPKGRKSDDELIEALNKHYKQEHGGLYRPQEIVDYLHQRFYDIRKAVVSKCFNRLVKENRISLEEVYILVTPEYKWKEDGKKERLQITNKVSDKKKYDEVRATEEVILEKYDVTRNRYNSNINIRVKSKEIQALFDEMSKTIAEKHGVKMVYKAYIPTVLDEKQKVDISHYGVNEFFLNYVGYRVQNHHATTSLQISTYFKTRFMYISFYVMLEKVGFETILNKKLYLQEVANFNMEHEYYMEDVGFSQSFSFFGSRKDRQKVIKEVLKTNHTERGKVSKLAPTKIMSEDEKNKIFEMVCENEESERQLEVERRQLELIERLEAKPVSDIALYVNEELGGFFDMEPVYNKSQIESVALTTNSENMGISPIPVIISEDNEVVNNDTPVITEYDENMNYGFNVADGLSIEDIENIDDVIRSNQLLKVKRKKESWKVRHERLLSVI